MEIPLLWSRSRKHGRAASCHEVVIDLLGANVASLGSVAENRGPDGDEFARDRHSIRHESTRAEWKTGEEGAYTTIRTPNGTNRKQVDGSMACDERRITAAC
jgi:hypothetical protein